LSVFVMRVRPAPAAHSSNMRRTTAALHLVDAALHMRALTGRQEPHEPGRFANSAPMIPSST
jgi:hypothetical protein